MNTRSLRAIGRCGDARMHHQGPQGRLIPILAIAAIAAAALGQSQPEPRSVPEWPVPASESGEVAPETRAVLPESPEKIETADDLLGALERSGRAIESLRAGIRYTKTFALAGDEQVRVGEFYYQGSPSLEQGGVHQPRPRKLAVYFESLQLGTGPGSRIDRDPKGYIFDGQWLVETLPAQRRMVKSQVVAPGETFDPLRLGEGPFPIPIGQRRDEILSRFHAELLPSESGLTSEPLIRRMQELPTYQLRLIPRRAYAREIGLDEVRLWYHAQTLLPVLAWTLKPSGDEAFVELINVRRNVPIPPERLSVESPERGWDVEIRPWRGEWEQSP